MGISNTEVIAKEICDLLGLKHCNKLDLHFKAGSIATVEATFYPEVNDVKQFPEILKKFKLVPIEDDIVETTVIGDEIKSYKQKG